jgi:hypothetical protein
LQNIEILSLKDFFEKNKIDKVSLIKMDIEGGEYGIMESLDKETFSRIEAFVLEHHKRSCQLPVASSKGGLKSCQVGVACMRHVQEEERDEKFLERIFRENGFSVQIFPSQFDKKMGFILAKNRRK